METDQDLVYGQRPSKTRAVTVSHCQSQVSLGENLAVVSISSDTNALRKGPPCAIQNDPATDTQVASVERGYSSAMASDAIFHMFPQPGEQQHDPELSRISESERFIQKRYPTLYMNLNLQDHPSVVEVQYDREGASCPLCQLDRNTLDSIKVLKAHEVRGYLESYDHRFTEDQVNVHLAHTVRDENVIGVIQNMSVDLIGKSYSLANAASLRIMNRIVTHMGRPLFVTDQDMAKVHNDAVKQFVALAATYQALMKYKHSDTERVPPTNPLL